MTNSVMEIQDARTLFVIGSNTTEAHPVVSYYMKRAARRGAKLIVCDPRKIDLTRWATHHIQHRPGTDVALLNGLMNEILRQGWEDRSFIEAHTENFDALQEVVSHYPLEKVASITGVELPLLREVARILGTQGPASLCYTLGITEHVCGTDNVLSCANLQMLLGNMGKYAAGVNPLRGQNNVQGACDMGALPEYFHNYQRVDNPGAREKFELAWGRPGLPARPGMKMPAMLEGLLDGRTRALLCLGENLAMSEPNSNHMRKCLDNAGFLLTADIFETETTKFADLVVPSKCWGEADGTFTNTERRVQRVRAAVNQVGEAQDVWWILNEIGRRMGVDLGFQSSRQVWEEMRSLGTSYAGITWDRIDKNGIQWPAPTLDHPGVPYLHRDGSFTRGKGRFVPAQWTPPAEPPDADYPLTLSTGRRLWHYHTGTQTRRSAGFEELCPEELVEMSPQDAGQMGVIDGDKVEVISRRGRVQMKARITERCPKGVVWSCFHFREACINAVTLDAFDPITETAEYKACAVRVEKSIGE